MSDLQTGNWAQEQSFNCTISTQVNGVMRAVHHSRFWDTGPFHYDSFDDGWLRIQMDGAYFEQDPETLIVISSIFHFAFHSRTEDRLHYRVSLASERDRKLDISRNGYLGLYKSGNPEYWKIEPLRWSNNSVTCHLRDHQGNLVSITRDDQTNDFFLNVSKGTPQEFVIQRV